MMFSNASLGVCGKLASLSNRDTSAHLSRICHVGPRRSSCGKSTQRHKVWEAGCSKPATHILGRDAARDVEEAALGALEAELAHGRRGVRYAEELGDAALLEASYAPVVRADHHLLAPGRSVG